METEERIYFTDDVGYRWFREGGDIYPANGGGYVLECGCLITEPMWIAHVDPDELVQAAPQVDD